MRETNLGIPSISEFLPKECLILPSDCQQGLSEVLNLSQEMNAIRRHLPFETIEKIETLCPQIAALIQESMGSLKNFKKSGEPFSLTEALNMASDVAVRVATLHNRKEALTAAWNAALKVTREGEICDPTPAKIFSLPRNTIVTISRGLTFITGRDVVLLGSQSIAARAAGFEVVKNHLSPIENPFKPILEIYRMGAGRIWVRPVKGKNKFVVDFPVKINGREELACLVFDEKGGNRKVTHTHRGAEDCSRAIPIRYRRAIS